MKSKFLKYLCFFVFLFSIISSCSIRYPINGNQSVKNSGTIIIYTKSNVIYKLKKFTLADSAVAGIGSFKKDGQEFDFKGEIKYSDIFAIEGEKFNYPATIISSASILLVSGILANMYLADKNNSIETHSSYHLRNTSSGGSCPTVYSHVGNNYILESETYAGSVFKALERTVIHELRSLKPENDVLSIRLANDKPETHYTNKLELMYADIEKGNYISSDENGEVYTYSDRIKPITAIDFKGNNVLEKITSSDNNLWISDLNSADLSSTKNIRDGIVCEFQTEKPVKFINLIINGKNTNLADESIGELLKIWGINLFSWYSEINKKGAVYNIVNNLLRSIGRLHIFVEKDSKWTEVGSLPDVGAETIQQGFLHVNFDKPLSGKFKIKLQSTTGFWAIDDITASFSPINSVKLKPLALINSKFSNGHEDLSHLKENDNSYYVDTEGEYADFEFKNATSVSELERHYFVKISGFYCMWVLSNKDEDKLAIKQIMSDPSAVTLSYLRIFQNLYKK